MPAPVRLAHRVAELFGCSRADAEQYIQNGWVSVDGHVVEAPQHLVSGEQVELDPMRAWKRWNPPPSCCTSRRLRCNRRSQARRRTGHPATRWADDHSGCASCSATSSA
jgi:23S rRNA pseudouridine2604 synthase